MDDPFKRVADILDKYQQFASELLRLALLGIGAIGILITTAAKSSDFGVSLALTSRTKLLLSLSLVAFGICALASLLSRFFATDSLAYHHGALRIREKHPQTHDQLQEKSARALIASRYTTFASGALLFLAAMLLAVGFIYALNP
jgi:hypothetical protein